jgi:hypothetical protein
LSRLRQFKRKVLPVSSEGNATLFLNLLGAELGRDKPPFKASDGGRIDRSRELEEITQSEFQLGHGE